MTITDALTHRSVATTATHARPTRARHRTVAYTRRWFAMIVINVRRIIVIVRSVV